MADETVVEDEVVEETSELDAAEEGLEVPEPDDEVVEETPIEDLVDEAAVPPALSEHDAAVKDYHSCAGTNAARKQDRKYPPSEAEVESKSEDEPEAEDEPE